MSRTTREGAVAGLLGAGAVAGWFLIVDLMQGRPFGTPSLLGEVVLLGNASPDPAVIHWGAVAGYTVVHLAVFVLFGIVVAKLVDLAEREGVFRFALLMLFVVFEVFFYGLVQVGLAATRGLFPFWSVLAANTLAALVMGGWFYRRHPGLRTAFASSPLGT